MKTINQNFMMNALTIAVRGALSLMLAMPLMAIAEEPANAENAASNVEAAALKLPYNYVEIGAMNVTHDSAKFGEYNGLEDNRAYAVGNFDVRGGNAYDEGDGTMRWEAKGINLGTSSRTLNGRVSNQGLWDLSVSYDELRHYITDTYQTPFQGHMGGNNFVLPDAFGVINAGDPGTRDLTATQKSFFHEEEVYTDRKNTSFTAGYNFDSHWNVQLDYNHLNQSGAKLISSASEARFNGSLRPDPGGGIYLGEVVTVLMNPTHYQTDTVNFALNWTGDQGRLSASYFGSFFRDKNNSLTWSNPYVDTSATGTTDPAGFPLNRMSTAPDNQFNQFNLTGGYNFTPSTKLAGGLSYGRNTQDDSFLTNSIDGALPANSLNGLVVNTNANLKLTNQATKELALTAGVKFNERDNKTSSKAYNFFLVDEDGGGDGAANIPFSNKRLQVELAGDYRFNSKNTLRIAYEYNRIKRWCSDVEANCIKAEDNTDNTLGLEYRFKASNNLSLNAGYSYADRHANNNGDLNWESTIGPNDLNVSRFVPYFEASRKEQRAKAGVNWQATDKLDLGLTGRYVYDNYDSQLGVQSSDTWSLNLDATFSYSENGTVSAYASMQKRWRDMLNSSNGDIETDPVDPPTDLWTNRLSDDQDSIGINAKHKGLLGGKLELAGDLSYVYGKSGYTTNLRYSPATACSDPTSLICGSTPDITNKLWRVKLIGNYQVDKHSTIALGYTYQRLHSNDYLYNAYQIGFTPSTLLPTNQQDQSYSVNLLTATYTYNF